MQHTATTPLAPSPLAAERGTSKTLSITITLVDSDGGTDVMAVQGLRVVCQVRQRGAVSTPPLRPDGGGSAARAANAHHSSSGAAERSYTQPVRRLCSCGLMFILGIARVSGSSRKGRGEDTGGA